MRRLIMWNMVTLDGFFEGATKWDLDFHDLVWGEELEQLSIEQTGGADLLLFGRVTYEGMAAHWPTAKGRVAEIMNAIPKVVFSRTLDRADWSNTRLVKRDAIEEVAELKEQDGGDMLVFGSAELSASLMEQDLIDEFRLCIVPVVLGAGTPLFKPRDRRQTMNLVDTRTLATGGVIVRYQRRLPR
ncbi:MAG TPA: dihydrofolate reductase family protein [Longimicrobiales bacterium]|nr:dihydrofolate reductase family protein [Longimicrobiales bacterium]